MYTIDFHQLQSWDEPAEGQTGPYVYELNGDSGVDDKAQQLCRLPKNKTESKEKSVNKLISGSVRKCTKKTVNW